MAVPRPGSAVPRVRAAQGSTEPRRPRSAGRHRAPTLPRTSVPPLRKRLLGGADWPKGVYSAAQSPCPRWGLAAVARCRFRHAVCEFPQPQSSPGVQGVSCKSRPAEARVLQPARTSMPPRRHPAPDLDQPQPRHRRDAVRDRRPHRGNLDRRPGLQHQDGCHLHRRAGDVAHQLHHIVLARPLGTHPRTPHSRHVFDASPREPPRHRDQGPESPCNCGGIGRPGLTDPGGCIAADRTIGRVVHDPCWVSPATDQGVGNHRGGAPLRGADAAALRAGDGRKGFGFAGHTVPGAGSDRSRRYWLMYPVTQALRP